MTRHDVSEQGPDDEHTIDDISAHMPGAGALDRAALLPGMYVVWCARLGLLDADFAREHDTLVLRAKYGEGLCSELLVSGCAGSLRYAQLNERGAAFTRRYYSGFVDDWRRLFGEDIYSVEDSWDNYQKIAAVLTEALLGKPAAHKRGGWGNGAARRTGKWWQFWK